MKFISSKVAEQTCSKNRSEEEPDLEKRAIWHDHGFQNKIILCGIRNIQNDKLQKMKCRTMQVITRETTMRCANIKQRGFLCPLKRVY